MNLQKSSKKEIVSKVKIVERRLNQERHELYQRYVAVIDKDKELELHHMITEIDKILEFWEGVFYG